MTYKYFRNKVCRSLCYYSSTIKKLCWKVQWTQTVL